MTSEVLERLRQSLSDRYRIERELGAGGMATVYLAHDLKHDRPVAIKVLHPELGAVLGAERFLSEIRTTANLQHPNILPLFDSGAVDGLVFYVMPYVEGETLRVRLAREGQLSVSDAVKLAQGVASALDYAHRHGVIHRDIKPENILLQDGQALVADFGVALAVSNAGGARITQTGISVGTPQYMSPEQAAAERQLDGRSDQYSLAAVLYEMLAGEAPFTGPSAPAILTKLMTEHVPALTTRRPSVPLGLADAVHRALEKVPADRFATAAEFAEALTRERTGTYRAATPMAVRHVLRSRVVQVLGGVATVAVVVAGIEWARSARLASESGVLRLPITLDAPARTRNQWGASIRISPDGMKLLYQAGAGAWMYDLRSGVSTPISEEHTSIDASFSPGSDSVVIRTNGWMGQLWVVDLTGRRSMLLADQGSSWMHWAPDGWIYFRDLQTGFGISRVRVADRKREVLFTTANADSTYPENPQVLDHGNGILYSRRRRLSDAASQAEIAIFDLRTHRSRVLMSGVSARVMAPGYLLAVQADGSLLAARFDSQRMQLTGTPVKVLDDVESGTAGIYLRGSFDVSDEGTLVYVKRAAIVVDSMLVVDRTGSVKSGPVGWHGWIGNVTRAADGSRLAIELALGLDRPNIWVVERDGEPRRLTFGDVLDYTPRLFENERSVAFVSPRGGKNWDLYSVPIDGASEPKLMLDRPGDIYAPRFSASGQWVVFCERDGRDGRDVVAHRFGPDTATVVIAATDATECMPDVTTNARWVAFQSNESGRNEIVVRPLVAGTSSHWQVSNAGGIEPVWSARGDELFYVNSKREVMAVPVTTAAGYSFGAPRRLFALDDRTFWMREVLPDAQGFVLVRRHMEAPGQVMMIRNFTRLLRERVGR